MGLESYHAYTVVGILGDQVRLYNPHHSNPWFNSGSGDTFLGQNDVDNPTHENNGYFYMSFTEFTKVFYGIGYEQ